MHEGWLERDGVRLHYLDWRPSGPPAEPALFLLHGLSSNARIWERIARLLPARRIVALDQRGHGRSDHPEQDHSSPVLVADAVHVIRELDLGRPLVGGHSWGAMIALQVAAAHPELASGLVFVDGPTASFRTFMTWEEAARRMQPPLPTYQDLNEAAAAQQSLLGEAWGEDLTEFIRAGLVEAAEGGLVPTLSAPVRLEILRDLYEFRPEPLFARVQGPVLLAMAGQLWPGAQSAFVEMRRRSVEEVAHNRPDVCLRWYQSRHDVPLIRPSELAADVERTALAAGFWSVALQASELAAGSGVWHRPVHGDGEGWDAKDLLAHLASTQAALPAVAGTQPAVAGAPAGQRFDPDRWNASQIARRRERSPAELADELRESARRLQAVLLDAELDRVAAIGPFAGRPVGEAMAYMLAHQRSHLAELASALTG